MLADAVAIIGTMDLVFGYVPFSSATLPLSSPLLWGLRYFPEPEPPFYFFHFYVYSGATRS